MTRQVVPIAQISRRITEMGRLRAGVRSGKAMAALSTWRMTSHDATALQEIADLYGGTVKPWSDPKAAEGQYEVLTEAPELRIILPPDPLGGTPLYESWNGGGCDRRCDGETCTQWVKGPEGAEPAEVPCLCIAKGEMACKPITRLSVILAGVRFGGVWRLDTKSWNAAQEMPGMVEMIQSLQTRGLSYATLGLKRRQSMQAGVKHKFITPVLGLAESVESLVAGLSSVGSSLPSGPVAPALVAGPVAVVGSDDDVVDAELVDDDEPETPAVVAPLGDACPGCGVSVKDGRPLSVVDHVKWHRECLEAPFTTDEGSGALTGPSRGFSDEGEGTWPNGVGES